MNNNVFWSLISNHDLISSLSTRTAWIIPETSLVLGFHNLCVCRLSANRDFMKIITWSCNLRLKDKFEFLEAHNPDIAIVQECESLPKSFFPGARYQWAGKDQKKGLSVVDFTESSEVDQASMRILPSFCRSTSMAEGKNCWQPGRLGYVSRWLSQSNKINKDVCGQ